MMDQDRAVSIFERLGDHTAIAAVVDDFYRRVLADDRLRPAFAGVDLNALRRHQTHFLATALGAPATYQGRSMRAAHAGRGITDDQFAAVAGHLAASLTAASVPPAIVDQVIARVAPLAPEIVEPAAVA